MGDVVQLNARQRRSGLLPRVSGARVLELESPAPLRACLYQVGFDDPNSWQVQTPFKGDFAHKGLVASPHLVALNRDGRIRVVRMLDGDRPPTLDHVDAMTVYLDAWVAFMHYARCAKAAYKAAEPWVVFDDGERYELQHIESERDSLGRRACDAVRSTGLLEASTSEMASLLSPGANAFKG